MFEALEILLLGTLQSLFDRFGWAGVVALMVFENATGITPSEIVLAFAGWMLISGHDLPIAYIWLGGLYAALGSTLGASLTYWAARLGGRPLIDRIASMLRIKPELLLNSERQFQRWGAGLVFFGRMVPGVRTLINIPAGLGKMSYPAFLSATFAGTYLWCTILIGAGYVLGHEWALISDRVRSALPYLLAIAAAGLTGIWLYRSIRSSRADSRRSLFE